MQFLNTAKIFSFAGNKVINKFCFALLLIASCLLTNALSMPSVQAQAQNPVSSSGDSGGSVSPNSQTPSPDVETYDHRRAFYQAKNIWGQLQRVPDGKVRTKAAPAPPMVLPTGNVAVDGRPYMQPQLIMKTSMANTAQNAMVQQDMYLDDAKPMLPEQLNYAFNTAAVRFVGVFTDPSVIVPTVLSIAGAVGAPIANSPGAAVQGPPGTGGTQGSLAYALNAMGAGSGSSGAGASGGDSGESDAASAATSAPTPGLINVANENAGVPTSSSAAYKTIPQAVWMVQQMYKNFSVPLAILLLLPGAVITQLKAQIAANFNLKTEDATSPFEGILRAMIAIILIPATQLIVSYSIDVGNSLAFSVNPAVQVMPILGWLQQVAYTTKPSNNDNALVPPKQGGDQEEQPDTGDISSAASSAFSMLGANNPLSSAAGLLSGGAGLLGGGGSGGGSGGSQYGGGEAAGQSDDQSRPEEQSSLSQMLETMFNVTMYMFSIGILVMTAFQLALICYLYLLGPVAAAFFAWPTVKGKIFRPVFGNWVNAVITVSLWRFYWMVILAIMTNRVLNMGEGGSMTYNLQWEVAVFTCLIGLLFYVPMNPWHFDPGQAYRQTKFFGESIMQSAKGGGSTSRGAGNGQQAVGGGNAAAGGNAGAGGNANGGNAGAGAGAGGNGNGGHAGPNNGGGAAKAAGAGAGPPAAQPHYNNIASAPSGGNAALGAIVASTAGAGAGADGSSSAGPSQEMGGNTTSGGGGSPPLGTVAANNLGSPNSSVDNGRGGGAPGGSRGLSGTQAASLGNVAMLSRSASAGIDIPSGGGAASGASVGSGGSSGGGGHMAYSPNPGGGGETGSLAAPMVTFNPNVSSDAASNGLRENYGSLGAGGGGDGSPPTTNAGAEKQPTGGLIG